MYTARMELSERIEAAREHSKLTRQRLAERLDPPATFESVRTWESGEHKPAKHSYMQQIARITGVSYQWLSVGAGPMIEGESETLTPAEIAQRVRAMSRAERMIWLQEIAEAERQEPEAG